MEGVVTPSTATGAPLSGPRFSSTPLWLLQAMRVGLAAAVPTFFIHRLGDNTPMHVIVAGGLPMGIMIVAWALGLLWCWWRVGDEGFDATRLAGFHTAVLWGASLCGVNLLWQLMPWADDTERMIGVSVVVAILCATTMGSARVPVRSGLLAVANWCAQLVLPLSMASWYLLHDDDLGPAVAALLLGVTALLLLQRGVSGKTSPHIDVSEGEAATTHLDAEQERMLRRRFPVLASHEPDQLSGSSLRTSLHTSMQSSRLFFHLAIHETDPARRSRAIAATESALARVEGQLSRIQDPLQVNAGVQPVCPVPVSVAVVISRAGEIAEPLVIDAGLQLRLVPSSQRVLADPVCLEWIIRACIDNALRHARCHRILVGARRRADRVRIYVIDDGIGIEPAYRSRLFGDSLQEADDDGDYRVGVRNGLQSVRRMAAAMHGTAGLESGVGGGCAFFVELPRVGLLASES